MNEVPENPIKFVLTQDQWDVYYRYTKLDQEYSEIAKIRKTAVSTVRNLMMKANNFIERFEERCAKFEEFKRNFYS